MPFSGEFDVHFGGGPGLARRGFSEFCKCGFMWLATQLKKDSISTSREFFLIRVLVSES